MILAMLQAANPLGFLLWFLVFIIVAAIVIIGVKWLLGLAGLPPSHPLSIIIFLVMILVLLFSFFYMVPGLHVGH